MENTVMECEKQTATPTAQITPRDAKCFWAKVKPGTVDECWEWQRSVNSHGYGQIIHQGCNIKAHRFAFLTAVGPINSPLLRHSCENKRCCNPRHLIPGTHMENSHDATFGKSAANDSHDREMRNAIHIRDTENHPHLQRDFTYVFAL